MPTLVPISRPEGRHDDHLTKDDAGGEPTRDRVASDVRVVACVDVSSQDTMIGHHMSGEALRRLALVRMEHCVRPTDRVCLLGGSRLAVCFGRGSHRAEPIELGTRLARAMGDHLTVGKATLDLRVSVGVGTTTVSVEPALLTGAAIASTRSSRGRFETSAYRGPATGSTVTVVNVPDTDQVLHISRVDDLRARPSRVEGSVRPATAHRLLRRTALRHAVSGDAGHLEWTGPPAAASGALCASASARFSILIVDTVASETPRSAVQGVAAAARRLGVGPILSAADRPDTVVDDYRSCEPDAVVLILHPDTACPLVPGGAGTPWEHPARLTRSLVDAGAQVIALSVGASAAGVAACVEQGATGLLHVDALAEELGTVAKAVGGTKSNGTPRAEGNGSAANGRGRRHLPAPFDTLVHLTSTERKVLFHMMEGRAAGDIASELVVSLTTVRSHIRSILRKLNVNSQLAAVAIANGADPRPGAAV